jgi:hypothetical protein
MTVNQVVNIMAGIMILASFVLSEFVMNELIYISAFVGVMLIQSSFTGFCPASSVAKALGATNENCCKKD